MIANKKKLRAFYLTMLLFPAGVIGAGQLFAEALPGEVERLGRDLTPMGAERAGNEAGTIPEWTGGITQPPSAYRPGSHHPDPFAGESAQFSINAENMQDHRQFLSAGQVAMLTRYPDYRLAVYPSHRTAAYPERIYEKTMANAAHGKVTENGNAVSHVAEGIPFPLPASGVELMWNHQMRYKGSSSIRHINMMTPTTGGSYSTVTMTVTTRNLYSEPGATLDSIDNRLLMFTREIVTPPGMAGNVLLVYDSVNQVRQPRKVWMYNPGQRRVRRAPNVAYDSPSGGTDGMHVSDMTDMFNGAVDRYQWTLEGKRELYVPYNAYRVHSDEVSNAELVKPGHLNPDYLRYELHRVWVVEARLRSGQRHINPRRTYYIDEDSYQILMVDHYDSDDELWRYSEAHPINFYEVPTLWSSTEVHYDLKAGRYAAFRLDPSQPVPPFNTEMDAAGFTPQALRRRGVR